MLKTWFYAFFMTWLLLHLDLPDHQLPLQTVVVLAICIAAHLHSQYQELVMFAASALWICAYRSLSFLPDCLVRILTCFLMSLFVHTVLTAFKTNEDARSKLHLVSQKVNEMEKLFAAFMNHVPGATWIVNSRNELVFSNSMSQKIFGLNEDRTGSFPQSFTERIREDVEVARKGIPTSKTEVFVDAEGRTCCFLFTQFPILHKHPFRSFVGGFCLDVTKLYGVERRFSELSERYQLATQIGNIGVFYGSLSDQTIIWNEQMFNIFGLKYQEDPVPLSTFIESLHPEDRVFMTTTLSSLDHQQETSETFHFRIIRPTGEIRYIKAFALTKKDEWGKATHMLGINLDVTDSKIAELELIKAKEAAEAADVRKSELLAMMSHEVRTPMNGVIGFTNLLMQTDLNSEQKEYVEVIEACGKSLLTIVNDILDFTKIEAGKMLLETLVTDTKLLFRNSCILFQSKAIAKGISFSFEIDHSVPKYLELDPTRVGQVVKNLLSNSVKFTETGFVKVRIYCEPVPVTDSDSTMILHVEVSDSGIGMSADALEKIFQPFSQADCSISRKYGGTGLGLSICHQLCKLMGGSITVRSKVDFGSTFHATFKVFAAKSSEEDTKDTEIALLTESSKKLVLIAEDNVVNQKLIRLMMSKLGLRCIIVDNGDEAVKAYKKGEYDVVLMDLHMPMKSGIQATQEIREFEQSLGLKKSTPIIALTADALKETKLMCLSVGMNDYLTKPLQYSELVRVLTKWSH